jgi:hypothetical protein
MNMNMHMKAREARHRRIDGALRAHEPRSRKERDLSCGGAEKEGMGKAAD